MPAVSDPPPSGYADPRVRGGQPYPSAPSNTAPGNPALAAVLSAFLPAVGQFYNGDNKKGSLLLLGYLVSFLLAGLGGVGVIGILVIWVFSIFDAYHVASRKARI
jgi:hypothetical protein